MDDSRLIRQGWRYTAVYRMTVDGVHEEFQVKFARPEPPGTFAQIRDILVERLRSKGHRVKVLEE